MFQKQEILPSSNPKSPFYNNLPNGDSKPIDELVVYFKNYKYLVRNLINYLKEMALIKEFESNLNFQLFNSYNANLNRIDKQERPNLNKSKSNSQILSRNKVTERTPSDRSVTDKVASEKSFLDKAITEDSKFYETTNSLILNHHYNLYQSNLKHFKELNNKLIPKLENLHKNLTNKIKEIRSSLKNESFVNDSIKKEISKTGNILTKYIKSVEYYHNVDVTLDTEEDEETIMEDPFLLKLKLNYQLKNQLIKENYLFAAFINLQNISKDLLTYILKDLTNLMEKIEKINSLKIRNLNFDVNKEWERFIVSSNSFLNIYKSTETNQKKEIRHFKDLVIPYSNSIHNKCIRFGIIYKKLKLLKNYNRYYYLLTCNFLHEFKIENMGNNSGTSTPNSLLSGSNSDSKNSNTPSINSPKNKLAIFINHNDIPEKSYSLNEFKIVVKNEGTLKFNLVSEEKSFSFKCNNSQDFRNWVQDLKDLLQFGDNFQERFDFVEKKLAKKQDLRSDSRNPLSLSSSSINLPHQSLQGVFTPQIRTPSSSGSDKNPFDQSFADKPGEKLVPTISNSSINTNAGIIDQNITELTNKLNHENYLKLQQEYLKQQQEIITQKLKETEVAKDEISHRNLQNHQLKQLHQQHGSQTSQFSQNSQTSNNSQNSIKSPLQSPRSPRSPNEFLVVHKPSNSISSLKSINSMDSIKSLNTSKINNFLQENENLIIPKFFISDDNDSNVHDANLPTHDTEVTP